MIQSSRLTFPGSFGTPLDARYDHPAGPVRATALFAHCFTCSKDIAAASRISRALAHRGLGVLRFDLTGLGHSDGEFENTNFSSNVNDLVGAADHLRATQSAPSLLIGHSVGGTAVLAAAERIPEATGVVTIGAPSSPRPPSATVHPSDRRDPARRRGGGGAGRTPIPDPARDGRGSRSASAGPANCGASQGAARDACAVRRHGRNRERLGALRVPPRASRSSRGDARSKTISLDSRIARGRISRSGGAVGSNSKSSSEFHLALAHGR
jgi:alpha/beta superfamily hydrolase